METRMKGSGRIATHPSEASRAFGEVVRASREPR